MRVVIDCNVLVSGACGDGVCLQVINAVVRLIGPASARHLDGLFQRGFAECSRFALGMVQRYEATEYLGANLAKLIEVSRVLKVRVFQSSTVGRQCELVTSGKNASRCGLASSPFRWCAGLARGTNRRW